MFKLESERLKREFKITNGNFYASQILNKYSKMSFVPDGSGCEFVIRFTDGADFSAKGLSVVDSSEEDDKLKFVFEECEGVTVTLEYWVHDDNKTVCKQLTLDQQDDDRAIDFVYLDNIGIINSKTHLGVEIPEDSDIPNTWAVLGQPFYIDSLFFGCEFPGADSRIVHGTGRVKYYLGRNVGKGYKCPVTVMGGAKDNTVAEVKRAFFEYVDTFRDDITPRFNYNNWFETMGKANEASVKGDFALIHEAEKAYSLPKISSYVVDDCWNDYKAKFWSFPKRTFPEGLANIANQCKDMDSSLGMWISPRGGYTNYKKFAKKISRAKNGYINPFSEDICVASTKYIELLGDFIVEKTNEYRLNYWKLDGFALRPCRDASHDHMTGGKDDMYLVTDMLFKWVKLLEKIRNSGEYGQKLWINLTCYINPSPWWLQWANSIWLQNSDDIGFSQTADEESQLDEEITYRDARYFDFLCRRNIQLPSKAIYNHEPIYSKGAGVDYTDEEFEKYLYWNAARGSALNDLHLSAGYMNENKWKSLSKVMNFQKDNFEILKNTSFIGGDPEENNVYGFVSWSENGEGIIALRNPDGEKALLTLTLNKLMGTPEIMSDCRIEKICTAQSFDEEKTYSYNDKLELELSPLEALIIKFTKITDERG